MSTLEEIVDRNWRAIEDKRHFVLDLGWGDKGQALKHITEHVIWIDKVENMIALHAEMNRISAARKKGQEVSA